MPVGLTDAHEAELNGKKVCMKALRLYVQDAGGAMQKVCLFVHAGQLPSKHPGWQVFYREVVMWKRLQHPNIVPFLGVPTKTPPFKIICSQVENRRITEYVTKNPGVDRVNLVSRFSPTFTITSGDFNVRLRSCGMR